MVAVVTNAGLGAGRLYLEVKNLDVNDDISEWIDLLRMQDYPKTGNITLQVVRDSGATNTVQVDVEMANDTGKVIGVAQVTDVTGGASTPVQVADKTARYVRVKSPIVGSANSLSAYVFVS